jgi:hypothetical protein
VPIIAAPKSGSAFITTAIASVFDIPTGVISLGHSFGIPAWIRFAARYPIALHDHMPPLSAQISEARSAGMERLVIHVRDPRQFVVSLAHHVVRESFFGNDILQAVYAAHGFPGLLDASIERFCPLLANWLQDWLYAAECAGIELRVTTFEEFHVDPKGFLDDVLSFLSPGASRVRSVEAVLEDLKIRQARGGLNFRQGDKDEWRSVLTRTQVSAIAERCGQAFATFYPDLSVRSGRWR